MAIAPSHINSHAGIDEKAAVVASTLDDIGAKISAQLSTRANTRISARLTAQPSHKLVTETAPAKGEEVTAEGVAIAPLSLQLEQRLDQIEAVASVSETSTAEPVLETFSSDLSDVRQLAAEGHFQAIAYWLNEPLVAQNVYAQVLEDEVPGRLKVLVEFEKPPQKEKLIRFVCDRLYRLNSEIIEGVHIIVRPLGAAKTDWEKSVRIPTATERQEKRSQQASALKTKKEAVKEESLKPAPTNLVYDSAATQLNRTVVRGQFKFFRAAMMCGSAIAALFFGCFTSLILSDSLLFSSKQAVDISPDIQPWYGTVTEPDFSKVTEVSFRMASHFQGKTVEAAFETVAVIPHNDVVDPANPTVTLLFGGELALNDFVFEQSSDVDQLFSEIDIYQKADVSMVGLAEPLANASTSLQEDFHQRTRPQAAQAIAAGGIDIVGLASEGIMTYGARGLAETLNNLDRQGIYRVGAGRNQREAHRPEILEVKGQRIAYLGYNPDTLKGAEAEKAGVALTSEKNRRHIAEDIRAIRSEVDWVVVNYRWGDALEADDEEATVETTDANDVSKPLVTSVPEDWQKSLAHEAVDAGADLVVGYHPQYVQGAEIYRDRPIAYSLGDFTFNSNLLQDHDTAALKVSLRNQQMKVEFLPVTIRESKLQKATGEQGAAILHAIRDASKTFDQPMQFPTVIKAKPRYLPTAVDPHTIEPYTDEPDTVEPDTVESINESLPSELQPSTSSPVSVPALDPMMQESDALFIPEADEPLPESEILNVAPPESLGSQAETYLDSDLEDPWDTSEETLQVPSGDIDSEIETYAEPMIGPLSIVLPNF